MRGFLRLAPRIAMFAGFALPIAANAQPGLERTTIVTPLATETLLDACSYRLVLPNAQRKLRASWVIFERGADYVNWFTSPTVRKFSSDHHLALVLAGHCRSKEREDMDIEPEHGIGRALFTALDQFAIAENLPELKTAPVIVLGFSGAGSLVGRLAGYRPERYLAGIAYAPAQYDPLGVDTIHLSRRAMRAPQLIIANGADPVAGTERPYDYFRRHFNQGAPWTFAVQNRTAHCCVPNAQALILAWLDAILTSKRGQSGQGELGFVVPDPSAIRDNWNRPDFNVASARVDRKTGKGRTGELAAGWLPSKVFRAEWLSFVTHRQPNP